jgi:hypothetical protein
MNLPVGRPAADCFRHKRFIRTGVFVLASVVSLGILTLGIHSLVLAARLVLSVVLGLVGLEVTLIATYQVATGKPVPTTRWTSFLFGVRTRPTPPSARLMRLLGGLFLLVGLSACFTVANIWVSPQ